MLALMSLAAFLPPTHNPLIDEHIVYIIIWQYFVFLSQENIWV